jgi:hypothetical protein
MFNYPFGKKILFLSHYFYSDIINDENYVKRRTKMTIQQSDQVHENRIRDDIKLMLEYHILEALPLREACRRAGVRYTKNASQAKFTKAGRAFVTQLMRRRRVLQEFDVDEPCLARMLEIRDEALKAGSHIAAVRAHELCVRVAANSDKKRTGNRKAVDVMTREEMIAELQELELRARGDIVDTTEDPLVAELRESMGAS